MEDESKQRIIEKKEKEMHQPINNNCHPKVTKYEVQEIQPTKDNLTGSDRKPTLSNRCCGILQDLKLKLDLLFAPI